MPMTFDDERLLSCGKRMFRPKKNDEPIEEYRARFADDQEDKDPVQSFEIRTGKPWDKWDDRDLMTLITKKPELLRTNPMIITRAMALLANR